MQLEQEIASIMSFALAAAGSPSPYYYDVPEDFVRPAMFFPQPEIDTGGETFHTYNMDYAWYINIFADTTEDAQVIGMRVLTLAKQCRNCVPLIDEEGNETGRKLRMNDPSMKPIDTGVVQLVLTWRSRRPYTETTPNQMVEFETNIRLKTEEIAEAMQAAVTQLQDYPKP